MDQIFAILTAVIVEAASPLTAGLAIAVIGLNIHFGYTGLINFGQAGFMLLGAYGMAISLRDGLGMLLAVLIGLGCAVIFAIILGIPTLKLRGDYLAIVTISAAEIIRFTGRLSLLQDFTGGALGIRGQNYRGPFNDLSPFSDDPGNTFTLFPFNYTDVADGAMWVRVLGLLVFLALVVLAILVFRAGRRRGVQHVEGDEGAPPRVSNATRLQLVVISVLAFVAITFTVPQSFPQTGANGWWIRIVAWSLVLISSILVYLLVRSPWGRLLRGVREDEDAIRSLGKNVFAVKMQALIIGGMFGALGGMIYVLPSTVQPDGLARQITFLAYTALLLGGAATVFGPVLGSVLFFSARILIREVGDTYVPDSIMNTQESDQFAFIVVGVVLMLLVIFRPQGILGNKKELRINV